MTELSGAPKKQKVMNMKAYKEKEEFVPVILKLETQEEVNVLYNIGLADEGVPKVLENVQDIPIKICEEVCNKLTKVLGMHKTYERFPKEIN